MIGIGHRKGEHKTVDPANNAINSPLLEASIRGAHSMLINFTVGKDTSLLETQDAVDYITEAACGKDNDDCNIIFGVMEDSSFNDEMTIAIIATDFNKDIDFSAAPMRNPNSTFEKQEEKTEVRVEASDTMKRINEDRNSSVLPSFLRNKMHEPVVEEKKDEPVVETKEPASDDDDDEPEVLAQNPDIH